MYYISLYESMCANPEKMTQKKDDTDVMKKYRCNTYVTQRLHRSNTDVTRM